MPIPPLPPVPPKPEEEGISWIWLFIILLLIVASAGAVYWYCKRPTLDRHDLETSNQGAQNYVRNGAVNEPLAFGQEERLRTENITQN